VALASATTGRVPMRNGASVMQTAISQPSRSKRARAKVDGLDTVTHVRHRGSVRTGTRHETASDTRSASSPGRSSASASATSAGHPEPPTGPTPTRRDPTTSRSATLPVLCPSADDRSSARGATLLTFMRNGMRQAGGGSGRISARAKRERRSSALVERISETQAAGWHTPVGATRCGADDRHRCARFDPMKPLPESNRRPPSLSTAGSRP
jgi:hypothetical protein